MKETKFKVGDKVRILDGSKIENYTGGWSDTMHKFVGKTATIAKIANTYREVCASYRMKEFAYRWDERGLELAEKSAPIVHIWCEGNKVYAKNVLSSKTAVARCSPEDTFDFLTGAKLALERLDKIDKPLAVGDEVRVINTGEVYSRSLEWVCENVEDNCLKARWAYGHGLGYPEVIKLDDKFIIKAIANGLAFIEYANPAFLACHVIGIRGLERW